MVAIFASGAQAQAPGASTSGRERSSTARLDLAAAVLAGEELVDAGEAMAIAEQKRVPVEAARALVVLQPHVNALYDRLARTEPDNFAGIWFDEEVPGLAHVAWKTDAAGNTQRVASGFLLPEALEPTEVRHSLTELEAARAQVAGAFDSLHRAHGVNAFYTDPSTNSVVIEMPGSSSAEAQQAVLSALPPGTARVRLVDGEAHDASIPPSRTACEYFDESCNPLRGGIESDYCTLGFNANASIYRYIVTAGHCGDSLTHSYSSIGPVINQQYGGDVDAQVHAVPSGWSTRNWIAHRSDAQSYPITAVQSNSNIAQHATLCHRGMISGETPQCHPVQVASWSGLFLGEYWYDMLTTNWCNRKGDSGGPVYANYTAFGVMKGYYDVAGFCDFTISSHTHNVQRVLGVEITTR